MFFKLLLLLTLISFISANIPEKPAEEELLGITRAEVMTCAKDWVSRKIPYCQCNGAAECCGNCPYCGTTRCDCSGYVSYCWKLGHGYVTSTLPQVSTAITKNELREGDILLNVAEHVVIFGGWCDSANRTYHAYQEPGCHTNGPHYAYASCVTYPFSSNGAAFKPYRYRNIS